MTRIARFRVRAAKSMSPVESLVVKLLSASHVMCLFHPCVAKIAPAPSLSDALATDCEREAPSAEPLASRVPPTELRSLCVWRPTSASAARFSSTSPSAASPRILDAVRSVPLANPFPPPSPFPLPSPSLFRARQFRHVLSLANFSERRRRHEGRSCAPSIPEASTARRVVAAASPRRVDSIPLRSYRPTSRGHLPQPFSSTFD